jgi:hypothetical protein
MKYVWTQQTGQVFASESLYLHNEKRKGTPCFICFTLWLMKIDIRDFLKVWLSWKGEKIDEKIVVK